MSRAGGRGARTSRLLRPRARLVLPPFRCPGPGYPSSVTSRDVPRTSTASGEGEVSGSRRGRQRTMIPGRDRRRLKAESVLMRLVATGGIVGIGVLLGAVLGSQDVQGWIVGLVVALVSVILSAVLWSSRQL
jgi:hypothetical protein